ncbi:HU family DNA-binding protein [Thermodesulfatator atlanticus]|uniref:HU family DNA-binding protein n=1 Tax=Thermodesulfatator atlanticus TaxID=501497 RepID=UPI0003B4D5E3|nr:HU family DNA-binding protein [Thermodesulfatator atlanticus]
MTQGRKEFFEAFYQRVGQNYARGRPSRFETRLALETILDLIEKALLCEDTISIAGFGKFEVKVSKPRIVRDFAKGELKKSRPKKRIVFTPSATLTRKLNF